MAVDVGKNISGFLSSKQVGASSELASEWAALDELHTKKLYHQLTLKLMTFVKHPSLQEGEQLLELYSKFIMYIENKINPLSLVEILAFVVQQYTDWKEAVSFLEKMEVKVKGCEDAVMLCKVLAGQILLEKLSDTVATKKIIDDVEKELDKKDGVGPVHGRFYLLASNYYRQQGKHAEYYRTALRYLGCVNLDDLSFKEQMQHAFFLGLAALLGEGVYNLGELLAHPVLQSMKNTPNKWLVDLLLAFNSGDIAKFDEMKPKWAGVPDLAAQELKLRQKISLLCLMEMTFKRPSTDRQLTFEEIAAETRLPVNEVELLVMKALAQGLVKGAIDQVDGRVHMTWVQPRVLDKQQIATMVKRLDVWCKDVKNMEQLLETQAHDFLTL